MAQLVKNLPAMQETWIRSLGWEDPLEKGKATQYSGLENSMDSIVLGVTKSQIRLSDFHTHTSGPAQFRNALTTVESSLTLGPPWSFVLFLFYLCIKPIDMHHQIC